MSAKSNLAYNRSEAYDYTTQKTYAYQTRNAYIYPSQNAYGYPAQNPYSTSNVRIKVSKENSRQKVSKANLKAYGRLFLIVACAFMLLFRGLMITDKTAAVEQKQAELAALIATNEKLQVDIDRSLDLSKVETIARESLGMRQAEKYQTIYVNLEKEDHVEKVAKGGSFLEEITSFLGGLVAYLG